MTSKHFILMARKQVSNNTYKKIHKVIKPELEPIDFHGVSVTNKEVLNFINTHPYMKDLLGKIVLFVQTQDIIKIEEIEIVYEPELEKAYLTLYTKEPDSVREFRDAFWEYSRKLIEKTTIKRSILPSAIFFYV